MSKSRAFFKSVYLKGEIYFFGSETSVDKYSIFTKTWEWVSDDEHAKATRKWEETICLPRNRRKKDWIILEPFI